MVFGQIVSETQRPMTILNEREVSIVLKRFLSNSPVIGIYSTPQSHAYIYYLNNCFRKFLLLAIAFRTCIFSHVHVQCLHITFVSVAKQAMIDQSLEPLFREVTSVSFFSLMQFAFINTHISTLSYIKCKVICYVAVENATVGNETT